MSRSSGRIALCGITAALSLLFLLLTALPVTEMALPALAGVVLIPVVIELGRRAGLLTYVAVSLLALLVVPSLEGKALYVAFFGYYPIVKALLESRRPPRALEWTLKLLVFNLATVTTYWLLLTFFALPAETFTIGGVSLPWVFLLLGNGVFVLYDWGLSRLITAYIVHWQPRVHRLIKK
mgnify:CR=1 FL=1